MCFRPPSFDSIMKKCDNCGSFNPPENTKCKKCGADLPEGGDDSAAAAMNMAPGGPMGAKGPVGPKGLMGPKGPVAPKGPVGPKGPGSPAGSASPKGPNA